MRGQGGQKARRQRLWGVSSLQAAGLPSPGRDATEPRQLPVDPLHHRLLPGGHFAQGAPVLAQRLPGSKLVTRRCPSCALPLAGSLRLSVAAAQCGLQGLKNARARV